MRPVAFDCYHPAVAGGYFAAVLVLTMACLQPVLVATSLLGACAYCLYLHGARHLLRMLAWQLPLLLVIMLVNPLFSHAGSTLLAQPFGHPVYVEGVVYGACMGALLVAVMQWFSAASVVLGSDKVMALAAGRLPTVSLMTAMTLRLVPQYVRRGRCIDATQRACTVAAVPPLTARARQVSVLMGWSLEDSLETADAMRARGWGGAKRRSSYRRCGFAAADARALTLLAVLVALSAAGAVRACAGFTFYPVLSPWAPWYVYLPFAAFAFLPLGFEFAQSLRWRHLR